MSVVTNAILKLKQFAHNAGSNSNSVSDAIDDLTDFRITVSLPNAIDGNDGATAANDTVAIPIDVNCKLVGCNFAASTALANTAGDDVVVTVKTNGVSAATYNTNTGAQDAVAANGVGAFSVNTVNSFVDAGESITVSYTMADNTNNYLDGVLLITLRHAV